MANLTNEMRAALGGALIVAVGVSAMAISDSNEASVASNDAGISVVADGAQMDDIVDPSAYNAAVMSVRAADPTLVDFLTAQVLPDEAVSVQVGLSPGFRLDGLEAIGPSVGKFEIGSISYADSADVTMATFDVRNIGSRPVRFIGVAHAYASPVVDAGTSE